MITQKHLKECVEYSEDTGLFKWLSRPVGHFKLECTSKTMNTRLSGKDAGSKCLNGYLAIRIDDKLYTCHRLAWLYVHGELPNDCIDHINGIRDDNRIVNLRDIPKRDNSKNMKLSKRNKSGVNGVSWFGRDDIWVIHTNLNGKAIHIGRSKSIFEAACMSISARNKMNYDINHGRR